MKQIIFRQFPGIQTVMDFIFGEVINGQFAALPLDECPFELPDCIHRSTLLGSSAYIETKDVFHFLSDHINLFSEFTPYPGYFVFTINPSLYETEKSSEE